MSPLDVRQTLRDMRRAYGLSQKELADALGVRQASVSRWESGREDIPMRRQYQLQDFFLNRQDAIHPLLERMVRRDQSYSLFARSGLFVRAQRKIVTACGLNSSDVDGQYKQDWYGEPGSVLSRVSDPDESAYGPILFRSYEGDLLVTHKGVRYAEMRIRGAFYDVNFDGHTNLLLVRADQIPAPTGLPAKSLKTVRLGQLVG